MATYSETIELKDMVSGPAKAASAAVSLVGKGIASVNGTLVKVGTSAAGAVAPVLQLADAFNRMADAMARLAAMGPIKAPKLPAESKLPGAAAPKSLPASTGAAPVSGVRPVAQTIQAPPLSATRSVAPTLVSQVHAAAQASAPAPGAAPVAAKAPVVPAPSPVKVPVVVDTVSAVAQFKTLTGAIKSGESSMTKAAALGDQMGFDKAAAKVGELKGALAKLPEGTAAAAGGTASLSKSLWNARNAMDVGRQTIEAGIGGIKNAFASLARGDVKGAIAGVTESIAGMAKMLDMAVPGLGQAVSAVVSIGGGLAAALAGGAAAAIKFAVSINQAERSAIASFTALGNGVTTGEEVKDMLDGLSDKIGIADDVLEPLTKDFMKMGVTGVDALEKLTLAAISANAIVGSDEGAKAFTALQKRIQLAAETGGKFQLATKQLLTLGEAGTSVTDIAAKMGISTKALTDGLAAGTIDAKAFGDAMTDAVIGKGAGPLQAMGAEWGNISKMLDKSIGDMFKGIDIGPLMVAVKDFFAIFQQANPSGQALKSGIAGAMTAIITAVTPVIPMIKHFLLDMVIWGLKAYIGLKPLIAGIREFFAGAAGGAMLKGLLDGLLGALTAVAVVIGAVVAVGAGMVAFLVLLSAGVGSMIGGIIGLGAAITEFVVGAAATLMGWIAGAPQLATDFINGLVAGISTGATAVANAVSGVASGAVDAFTNFLGIKSPSKVMMGLGAFTSEGFAAGIEGGAPDVHGAASGVASMAVAGAADPGGAPVGGGPGPTGGASGAAAPGGGGGGTVVNIAEGAVVVNGAGKDVQAITQEAVAGLFEQFAMQAGL